VDTKKKQKKRKVEEDTISKIEDHKVKGEDKKGLLGQGGPAAKESAAPGKRMKRVFLPNLVVRGKPTKFAGSDGWPTSYWQKESKGPLQKVAAKLGLKRVPTLHEYLKYTERDVLKVPSWTLPPCHDK
jgi:hypothetical protein